MRITLRQLRVFDAVAHCNSVSKAAEEISLSQSASSMALSDLEKHLGAPLFHRHGKRLLLNDYGRWLQPKIHLLLQQAQEIEQSARTRGLHGALKIGASSTIGNYLLPRLIAGFVQDSPDVKVDLKVGNTEQVIEDMLSLKIDLGLIEGLCHTHQLIATPWRTDTLKIFCNPTHPLAGKPRISLIALNSQPWILRETGSGTREIFTVAIQGKLEQLQVKLELGNSEAVKQAVKAGLGLGCLSELAIASEVNHGELIVLPSPSLNLQRELFIIQRKDTHQSQLLKALWNHLNLNN